MEETKNILNGHIAEAKNIIEQNFDNGEILIELADYIANRGE